MAVLCGLFPSAYPRYFDRGGSARTGCCSSRLGAFAFAGRQVSGKRETDCFGRSAPAFAGRQARNDGTPGCYSNENRMLTPALVFEDLKDVEIRGSVKIQS